MKYKYNFPFPLFLFLSSYASLLVENNFYKDTESNGSAEPIDRTSILHCRLFQHRNHFYRRLH